MNIGSQHDLKTRQWTSRLDSSCMQKVGCENTGRDRSRSLKQALSSTAKYSTGVNVTRPQRLPYILYNPKKNRKSRTEHKHLAMHNLSTFIFIFRKL